MRTITALVLVLFCLWAAQWQFHRGVDRHQRNSQIEKNTALPKISLEKAIHLAPRSQWRTITTEGKFDPSSNLLLRNHYFEGKYGFEVLTLFRPTTGDAFWVDRGWVIAGETAQDRPEIPPTPTERVFLQGRFRLNTSLPQGTIFATGNGSTAPLIREINAQKQISNQLFYIDLLSGSDPALTPDVPAELPELSDGPHFAYSAQWVIFAGLVVYGRILMRKTDLGERKAPNTNHQ